MRAHERVSDPGVARAIEALTLEIDDVELHSVITCPQCRHAKPERMPTDSCLFFYECESCRSRLRPKAGDCCVFCSYGSVKCPPVQQGTA